MGSGSGRLYGGYDEGPITSERVDVNVALFDGLFDSTLDNIQLILDFLDDNVLSDTDNEAKFLLLNGGNSPTANIDWGGFDITAVNHIYADRFRSPTDTSSFIDWDGVTNNAHLFMQASNGIEFSGLAGGITMRSAVNMDGNNITSALNITATATITAATGTFTDGTVATTPSADTDLANKKYVDDEIVDKTWLLATNQTGITGDKTGDFSFRNDGSNVFGPGVRVVGTVADVSLILDNTTGVGGSPTTTIKTMHNQGFRGGKIVFGRQGAYSMPSDSDSFMDFYTALDNVDTLAFRIDRDQDVSFERSLRLIDDEGIFFGTGQDAKIAWASGRLVISSQQVTANDDVNIDNFDEVRIRAVVDDLNLILDNATGIGTTGTLQIIARQFQGFKGGKLVFGRENIYLNVNQRDSFFEVYTATDNVDILALRIDSNQDVFFENHIVLPKASTNGIKIDTTTPTFGFADIIGDQFAKNTGATKPILTAYNGVINSWRFEVGDEAFITYHIPHNYVKGTDVFLHIHWSHTSALVTGGTVTFKATSISAKAHNQMPFGAPVVGTFTGTASTTQYQQILSETQYSASSPTGLQIDTDILEPDGVIELTFEVDANDITVSSGGVPDIFVHYIDIHYQTTGLIGTKAKAPDFYI